MNELNKYEKKIRIGKFCISGEFIRTLYDSEPTEEFKALFSKGIIIVNCENRLWKDQLIYTAIWDRFDPVSRHMIPPSYEIRFKSIYRKGKLNGIRILKPIRLAYDF